MELGSAPRERGERRERGGRPPVSRRTDQEGRDVLPGPIPATGGSGLGRLIDIIGAGALLVLSFPVLAVGMAAVWRASGRPVFFAHRRIGLGGRPFRCWKLRTMETGAEERLREDATLRRRHRANGFKLPEDEDPRVIPGTEWLRRTHVDELPQLLNVLKGEMSLVGPRPVVRDELALYGEAWTVLLSRRPGVVGAWTALGAGRPPYPERAELELDYVRRAGLWTDLAILLRTLTAPFRRRVGG